jgi:hypothetical protein
MRFFCFHLMPWAHLPEDCAERYDSAWVTCPNMLKRHGLSLVAAADQCYVACDAPNWQMVMPRVSLRSSVSMEVAWHSGCSSPA